MLWQSTSNGKTKQNFHPSTQQPQHLMKWCEAGLVHTNLHTPT